jgi:hypothetical protein
VRVDGGGVRVKVSFQLWRWQLNRQKMIPKKIPKNLMGIWIYQRLLEAPRKNNDLPVTRGFALSRFVGLFWEWQLWELPGSSLNIGWRYSRDVLSGALFGSYRLSNESDWDDGQLVSDTVAAQRDRCAGYRLWLINKSLWIKDYLQTVW